MVEILVACLARPNPDRNRVDAHENGQEKLRLPALWPIWNGDENLQCTLIATRLRDLVLIGVFRPLRLRSIGTKGGDNLWACVLRFIAWCC